MPQITIDIPAAQANRVLDAVAAYRGYRDTINGSPNPETKGQFVKRTLIDELKMWIKVSERAVAEKTVDQSVETGITLT